MLSAIGSSAFPGNSGAGASTAGLEAQLDKYQIQLADWVSCPSGKTPEGKTRIQEISDKISELEQRIKAADTAKRSSGPAVTDTNTPTGSNKGLVLSVQGITGSSGNGFFPASTTATGAVGNLLDVFA